MVNKNVVITIVIVIAVLIAVGVYMARSGPSLSPPPQCDDKLDNDGDGRCDYLNFNCRDNRSALKDSGCVDKKDDSEASCVVGSTTCGLGACQKSSTCVNDQVRCIPGPATTEICTDQIDNDCDGVVNDGCTVNNNTCTETDGGDNPNVRGTTNGLRNGQPYSHTDFCLTNTSLLEYYCRPLLYDYNHTVNCVFPGNSTRNASTICSNGACI